MLNEDSISLVNGERKIIAVTSLYSMYGERTGTVSGKSAWSASTLLFSAHIGGLRLGCVSSVGIATDLFIGSHGSSGSAG